MELIWRDWKEFPYTPEVLYPLHIHTTHYLIRYKGDNRIASTREDVTARGRAKVNYDYKTKLAVVERNPRADETIADNWGLGISKKKAEVYYKLNQYSHGNKKVIDLMYSTKNPLTPKIFTPYVDVKARYVLDYDVEANAWDISFTVYGDGYPSTEAFIEDMSGQRLFLGARKEEETPAKRLYGGPEKLLFTGKIRVNLDESYNFKSIVVGSGNEAKEYSVQDWNKLVEQNFKNED